MVVYLNYKNYWVNPDQDNVYNVQETNVVKTEHYLIPVCCSTGAGEQQGQSRTL